MYHLVLYPFLAWEMIESSGRRGEFCVIEVVGNNNISR